MARYRFSSGKDYAARLLAAIARPIENEDKRLRLLRLEFEVFPEIGGQLRSLGKIASRDLVIGPESRQDPGVLRYARALAISRAEAVADWLEAAERAPWVRVVFDETNPQDNRNPFRQIRPYDPFEAGIVVIELDPAEGGKWAMPKAAAEELGCSTATVRRRLEKYKAEWGSLLVRLTPGGHRRINVALLRDLASEDHGIERVIELRHLRELCRAKTGERVGLSE